MARNIGDIDVEVKGSIPSLTCYVTAHYKGMWRAKVARVLITLAGLVMGGEWRLCTGRGPGESIE